jgi:hypothetical protein
MEGISKDVDCITYISPIDKGKSWNNETFLYSIKYYYDFDKKTNTFFLSADQKCPIKKEIINKVKFKHIRFQEDLQFLYDIHPLLKTEWHIDKEVYLHRNRSNDSMYNFNKRYGIQTNKLI